MTVLTPTHRGTSNTNSRGSAASRRIRKQWLLDTFGNGIEARCELELSAKCEGTVTFETITVDRFPIPGCMGGTYKRGNIRPACGPCNSADGGQLGATRRVPLQTAV